MLRGRLSHESWIAAARAACAAAACALCGIACAAASIATPPAPAADSRPWRIVLIRSWDSLYPLNIVRETALRAAIQENSARMVEFYPEEIDPLRFPAGTEPALVSLLQRKYRDTPVDLVIASGIEPLEFASLQRDVVWPGAAIVFNGVFEGTTAAWTRPPRATGVTVALDVEGAVALGRALTPSAQKLYVVGGTSPIDRALLEVTLKKLAHLERPLEVHTIVGLTRQATAARVSAVERDSLVLYVTMLRDANGEVSGPGAPAMQQVSASSPVPVLSLIQTQYGRGVVGGSSPRLDRHGRAAGLMAVRVLEGADPDLIPVVADPDPTCEVDWNALERWQVPRHNVPTGCAIVNRPPDPVRLYLWPMVALLSIILLEAALIWSLAMQSRRRRAAEQQLHARTAEMAHVARLSTIGALTASIAHEINQPMGTILSNTEAAQMMLEQGTLSPDKLREILADVRGEVLRASEVIQGLRKLLARHEWHPTALETNAEVAAALRHVAFEAARRDVRLTPLFGRDMPAVMGDSVQLQQVVINLVVNAIEAVSSVPGARREVLVETRARTDGVEIEIADHGPGVSPENAARLFESNFTTKQDGMGLGLAIVRTIVETHRGRVWFEPNVPRGSVFHVWLVASGT